ncbi:MAG: hypothetical protein ACTTIX_05290 [Peptoanaerobacter stomatis]
MKSKVKIRFANAHDVSKIMTFIKKYWAENHILANNKNFFEYQHKIDDKITYVIAENDSGEILGLIGYIPYSNEDKPDIATALWKSIDSTNPLLGYEILRYVINNTNSRIACCCGINTTTFLFYRKLGYTIGTLEHYYRLNDIKEYKIAIINDRKILENPKSNKNYELKEFFEFNKLLLEFNFSVCRDRKPYKSKDYIKYRYFEHPIYKYKTYGIIGDYGKCNSIIVTREQCVEESRQLRIIDFFGVDDDLKHIYNALGELMCKNNYEYVDFYQYGISEDILNSSGFIKKDSNDINVIPNYFEPFVQKNIDIHFYISEKDNFYLFKGDADQDRPNFY